MDIISYKEDEIQDKIREKLRDIEIEKEIKILLAVESGSRSWGFPSLTSDYDIRFIYMNKLDWYLSVFDKDDTISFIEGNLDFSGWDLKKSLKLLGKSNPSIIDWLSSKIIYKKQDYALIGMTDILKKYNLIVSYAYHFYYMAYNEYRDNLRNEKIKIKSYFYILRSIFNILWIKDKKTFPPIYFLEVFESVDIPKKVKDEIYKLIEHKRISEEKHETERFEVIIDWVKYILPECKTHVENIKKEFNYKHIPTIPKEELDKLFIDCVSWYC